MGLAWRQYLFDETADLIDECLGDHWTGSSTVSIDANGTLADGGSPAGDGIAIVDFHHHVGIPESLLEFGLIAQGGRRGVLI
jgi:hypothetical protein